MKPKTEGQSSFTVVALAEDLAGTTVVVSSEPLGFERLSLFSPLLASGERARFLEVLRDEAAALVDRAFLIGPGGMFPPLNNWSPVRTDLIQT
ncbi:hypothetical protein PILCRDRAFT_812529 [Piloderma croceum F 1598]|uniref:Uncharacterized protein n=1 Tax=Piloderma croceum (strain F 1598) TaxID=765440 RepID=A0A0C3GDE4_PILCF|nr:hypothetical protein PILCRDRAFT_812529 [Piloderma croceum F 1598]